MTAARGIVLDANILIRLVLGSTVRDLVLKHVGEVVFFAPRECFDDARRYLPDLLESRGVDSGPALEVLDRFEAVIHVLEESTYESARGEALARIESRDARDWPVLAAALVLECPVWTEDRDFFGTGVPTWTTDRVALYLGRVGSSEAPGRPGRRVEASSWEEVGDGRISTHGEPTDTSEGPSRQ